MLSVYHNITVLATVLSDNNILEEYPREDQADDTVTEDDTNAGSYVDDSNTSTSTSKVLMTHSQMGATGSELMVYPIASHSCQLVHLPLFQVTSSSPYLLSLYKCGCIFSHYPTTNFLFHLFPTRDMKPCLWLTCVIGSGSTGIVWQCCSDESSGLYVIKVVELLCKSDVEHLEQFRNEVEVYLTLEMAYRSRQLCNRITPYCYGAFKDDRTNVLVLELCDGTLNSWDELNN